jgi:spermidine synthase
MSSVAVRFPEEGRRPVAEPLVVGVFVVSGAAGLMYQVIWSRQLVLVFGNTTEAIGTIVTAFMAGLGLGGLVGGLIAPRLRRPLLVYGLVELCIGGAALMMPRGFQAVAGAYSSAYDTTSPDQLTVVRLALTMAVVTPVTFLMGLTLPLLTRHLVTSMRTAGAHMGLLYSANTLGAVAGTLLAGLVLIELLGLSTTAAVAVALNGLVGTIAVAVAARGTVGTVASRRTQPGSDGEEKTLFPGLRPVLYATTFVSGFVALALEVLWTRMLAEGTGSLIYNFVVILAVYLVGIGLGGATYRALTSPQRDTPGVLAVAIGGIGLSTLATVPLGTLWLGPSSLQRAVIMLPATVCMGYAFPLSARLLTKDPIHGSRSIGVLYAWNTAGSMLGSLAATFVLADTLGTNASVLVLAAADAAIALVLVMTSTGWLRPPAPPSPRRGPALYGGRRRRTAPGPSALRQRYRDDGPQRRYQADGISAQGDTPGRLQLPGYLLRHGLDLPVGDQPGPAYRRRRPLTKRARPDAHLLWGRRPVPPQPARPGDHR